MACTSKRLIDATFEDLKEFLDDYLKPKTEVEKSCILKGMQEIADFLHVSKRKAQRLKKESNLSDFLNQNGRTITAETEDLKKFLKQ